MGDGRPYLSVQQWMITFLILLTMCLLYMNFNMSYIISQTNKLSIDSELIKETVRAEMSTLLRNQALSAPVSELGKKFPPVKNIPSTERLRILVTGGAGFVGSNLVDRLMMQGHMVTVVDNLFTGRQKNIMHWEGHPNFKVLRSI